MKARAPAPTLNSIHSSKDVDLNELEKLFRASTNSVSTLFSDSATSDHARCMIPGCLDPHPWLGVPVPAAPITLGGAAALGAFRAELRDKGLRWAALNATRTLVWVAWNFLRQASGDDAYERYLAHMVRAHPGQPVMNHSGYYRFRTEQKWSRITRCC
jgi:uncharacterized short protein YbdD (DUF466 family)